MTEPTPAPETPATPEPEGATPPPAPEVDYAAEAEKWKALARKHEERAKANSSAAQKLADIEAANKTEAEKLSDQLKAAQDRAAAMVTRAVQAEIRAQAAGKFADPDDARLFLDTAALVNDVGDIDTDAIGKQLAAVLKAKPHLAAKPAIGTPRESGASAGGTPPAGLDEQIAEAQARGDYATAISLTNRKLFDALPSTK